ncbi:MULTISPECIES: toll/interleukin-1 receptor domain-containing protein [Bacillus]|uniref:toll/interleukin-1 receptor domain-containing protein n=1 Tax=Bacillus TaxID=1386 RepID=UPI0011A3EBDC|nr:toll/interleukin-1 receptor domain-containing protein [Bacillus licheniformis]MCU9959276.1 hypothetical protein [Bacillus licheniformis]MDE1398290.1 toll/interleukin-1 receptor domain-containing protein [Bacillus licheniformis]MED1102594.1 toll/interleukin-1 receptor domain-containing protein [Bacillus licheniformis]TWN17908.1 hypothetical protein CHCC14562_2745 [Bacillus licheniformis]TWN20115.1 hypothetical protein CHCC14559_4528 [Bacillus licheniformis]
MQDVSVFISYSWTNDELVDWVREELATRLSNDGIEVILDQWDLKEGQDVYLFMESMVNNSEINKVLVICDKGYKLKADSRQGGVGTETQIITPEIYKDAKQEKFIPVIFERDEHGNDFIPTFMSGRKYIDLSGDLFYENYEQLLRIIYERPLHRKPKKGNPPAHLFEDEQINHYKFSFILKQLLIDVSKGKSENAVSKAKQFKNEFIGTLREFSIVDIKHGQLYQEVNNKIDDMLILKNDYVEFIQLLSQYNLLNVEFLIEFFEEFHNTVMEIKAEISSYYDAQFDHFNFLIREIFLYTIASLIKTANYEILGELLHSRFFVFKDFVADGIEGTNFEVFNHYIPSQTDRNNNGLLKLNERLSKGFSKTEIANADVLLYYISALMKENSRLWFPFSYIYLKGKVTLLQKMESTRHFEKVKKIFDVSSKEEFLHKVKNFNNPMKEGYGGFNGSIPDITDNIKLEDICKYR